MANTLPWKDLTLYKKKKKKKKIEKLLAPTEYFLKFRRQENLTIYFLCNAVCKQNTIDK